MRFKDKINGMHPVDVLGSFEIIVSLQLCTESTMYHLHYACYVDRSCSIYENDEIRYLQQTANLHTHEYGIYSRNDQKVTIRLATV